MSEDDVRSPTSRFRTPTKRLYPDSPSGLVLTPRALPLGVLKPEREYSCKGRCRRRLGLRTEHHGILTAAETSSRPRVRSPVRDAVVWSRVRESADFGRIEVRAEAAGPPGCGGRRRTRRGGAGEGPRVARSPNLYHRLRGALAGGHCQGGRRGFESLLPLYDSSGKPAGSRGRRTREEARGSTERHCASGVKVV